MKDMSSYVNQEFSEGGTYREYLKAREMKYATFRKRVNLMRRFRCGNPLIDIGCSCGYFLDCAFENNYDAYGAEFSSEAIRAASEKCRGRIIQCDINNLGPISSGAFRVATVFDVIEHTFNPPEFLKSLRGILKNGATVVITTPDTNHFLRYLMKSRWPMLQPMQHTVLFSKRSLRIALAEAGFSHIRMSPARKVVDIDYLMSQIKDLNPVLFHGYSLLRRILPQRILKKRLAVNIGEIMVLARAG
jgi:SAM-dependent methyltransferase